MGIQSEKMETNSAHVIVFGGGKTGSGRTTSAMHAAIALLRLGYRTATIDLDAGQATLTRYLENRQTTIARLNHNIPMPRHIDGSQVSNIICEEGGLTAVIADMAQKCDFIVMDTAEFDGYLSLEAHALADTLMTPLDDSLAALEFLGQIDPETHELRSPSLYTRMAEEKNVSKIVRGGHPMHWIVMRNRLSFADTLDKQPALPLLNLMAEQFGFQPIAGFSERTLFPELFEKGLTLLDMKEEDGRLRNVSSLAARQEVRTLIRAIAPEKIRGHARPPKSCRMMIQ